jgi:uncharacterized damage-inducible protein DinB
MCLPHAFPFSGLFVSMEVPMSIAESLLPDFDHEMATTRQLLECTPGTQAVWKPHPKSMSLGQLAVHLAVLPMWAVTPLSETELDVNPPGGLAYTPPLCQSTKALLRIFDENVQNTRAAIASTSDAAFMVPWTLKNGGALVFSLPRVAVLRSFVTNHIKHHRGQSSVYLRLDDVPLPSVYGPTADTGI